MKFLADTLQQCCGLQLVQPQPTCPICSPMMPIPRYVRGWPGRAIDFPVVFGGTDFAYHLYWCFFLSPIRLVKQQLCYKSGNKSNLFEYVLISASGTFPKIFTHYIIFFDFQGSSLKIIKRKSRLTIHPKTRHICSIPIQSRQPKRKLQYINNSFKVAPKQQPFSKPTNLSPSRSIMLSSRYDILCSTTEKW